MSNIESNNPAGYVDGFVISVPKKNLDRYREQATIACEVWKEYGAIDYIESVGEDLKTDFGTPFPKLAQTNDDDVVIFAYITYRDREHRDQVNKKVMADERIKSMCPESNPNFEPSFDMERFSYGGFSVLVKS